MGLSLPDGFILKDIQFTPEPLVDAIGRPALAKTRILGREIYTIITSGQNTTEISVSLYHEILEAMTVASTKPPAVLEDFNEADFERAAYDAHALYGVASPESLNRMLQTFGFGEK